MVSHEEQTQGTDYRLPQNPDSKELRGKPRNNDLENALYIKLLSIFPWHTLTAQSIYFNILKDRNRLPKLDLMRK